MQAGGGVSREAAIDREGTWGRSGILHLRAFAWDRHAV